VQDHLCYVRSIPRSRKYGGASYWGSPHERKVSWSKRQKKKLSSWGERMSGGGTGSPPKV